MARFTKEEMVRRMAAVRELEGVPDAEQIDAITLWYGDGESLILRRGRGQISAALYDALSQALAQEMEKLQDEAYGELRSDPWEIWYDHGPSTTRALVNGPTGGWNILGDAGLLSGPDGLPVEYEDVAVAALVARTGQILIKGEPSV